MLQEGDVAYDACGPWFNRPAHCCKWIISLCCIRFSVENAYLEEKEDVCNALAEISESVG